ncbi:MAG: hypothetical protein C0606_06405 [Hyphomicrobiales bacterium]|nr:MAG: hypothetical protein C0606_06405 [Hyphomicrobiales bacterium]
MYTFSKKAFARHLSAFRRDDRGNIAIIFAFVLIPILMFVGSAVDFGRAVMLRNQMSVAIDSAALAGAREFMTSYGNEAASKKVAKAYFADNFHGKVDDYDLTISVDTEADTMDVTVSAKMPTTFLGVAGMTKLDVSSTARTKFNEVRPVSVGMVLDVSGSMSTSIPGGTTRMNALKSASRSLLDILDKADPKGTNLRTGLTTFSTDLVDKIKFDNGSSDVRRKVERLRPRNLTQINAALDPMTDMIEGEKDAFASVGSLRFVILMTDGYSTVNPKKDVRATLANCTALKKAGIEVFTVNLDGDADTLRQCATSENHFFDTNNQNQFKKAFEAIALEILARAIRLAA